MASQQAIQPISKAGTAFFSSLCIATFGLGCWQSQRYFEKINLIKIREEELKMNPSKNLLEANAKCSLQERIQSNTNANSTIEDHPDDGNSNCTIAEDNRGFKPFCIRGQFRHQHEILIGPRGPPPGAISSSGPNSGRSSGGMSSSPQGYYVITPFERSNNMGIVLVNRGWIPRQFVLQNSSWERPKGLVDLVGVATKTEQPRFLSPPHNEKTPNQLLWVDRQAIEHKTKTMGLSPLLITETQSSHFNDDYDSGHNSNSVLFPIKPSIETVGEFKVLPSTHAGYAFTWFSLSGVGMYMTKKLVTKGRG